MVATIVPFGSEIYFSSLIAIGKYNNILNITDVIILLEHVLEINEFQNTHQNLLADINQDTNINIADVIINIENILNN